MRKRILAALTAASLAVSLAACGSAGSSAAASESTAAGTGTTEAAEEAEDAAEGADAATGEAFTVGICQQMPHVALDAATQGFKDALVEAFGEGGVEFDEQNAQGDSNTCNTIVNSFVSSG